VKVADAVHVSSSIEQRAHDVDVTVRCRPVKGSRVVSGLACVGIRALVQQQAHDIEAPVPGRLVQCWEV
jgi:hypothetical protein